MDFRQTIRTEKPDRGTLGKRQTTGAIQSRVLPRKDTDNLRRQRPAPPAVPSTSNFTATVNVPKFGATRTLNHDNSRGSLTERPSIQKCKQELRPLLNSIRTVESSLKRNSSERITEISIGPFQISRQYHEDAWKNGSSIVSNGSSWYRCRDLNHAESTVISYWIKICPEAVEKRDFETLAKAHHAGLQGIQRNDTEEYWSKVRQHLSRPKETIPSEMHQNKIDAKQEKSTSRALLPLATNAASNRLQKPSTRKTERGGATLRQPSCVQNPKQKVQKDNSWAADKFDDRQTPSKSSRHNLKHTTIRRKDMDIRAMCNKLEEIVFRKSGIHFQHVASGFNEAFSTLSQEYRRDKAALKIQSIWRTRKMRHQYLQIQNAARVIQKRWRIYMSMKNVIYSNLEEVKTPTFIPTKQQNIRYPTDYPYQVLYEGTISPVQEDALLTELAGLLISDKGDIRNESCFSFQLPCSNDSDEEGSTPKMNSPTASPDEEIPSFGEDTRTILSPAMEHATTELAKLLPQFTYSVSKDSLQSSFNYEDRYFNSSHLIYNGRVSKNDEIIKKLRFSSSMDEICWGNDAEKSLAHDDIEIQSDSDGDSCHRDNNEEELDHVPIPLLIDQSPMVVQKISRKRNRNPCNRKVEKALVSSLSEWQILDSSIESIQTETSGAHTNLHTVRTSRKFCSARKMNPPHRVNNVSQELNTSKELLVCKVEPPNLDHEDYMDDDTTHDGFFELSDSRSSTIYAAAYFQCLNF